MKKPSKRIFSFLLCLTLIFGILPLTQVALATPVADDFSGSNYVVGSFPTGGSYWSPNSSAQANASFFTIQNVSGNPALKAMDTSTSGYYNYNEAVNFYDGTISVAFQLISSSSKAGIFARTISSTDRILADITASSGVYSLGLKKVAGGISSNIVSGTTISPTPALNTWYVMTLTIDASANPHTITAKVFNADQTTHLIVNPLTPIGSNSAALDAYNGTITPSGNPTNTGYSKFTARSGVYSANQAYFDDFKVDSTTSDVSATLTGLNATATPSTVTLTWNQIGSNTSAYLIKKQSTSSTNWNYTNVGTSSTDKATTLGVTCNGTTCSYTDTGTSGSTNNYLVADASPKTSSFSFKSVTLPLDVPAGVTASPADKSVILSWSPVTGATGYNIYRTSTTNGTAGYTFVASSATTGYVDSNLTNGTTYYYIVTATNALPAAETPQVVGNAVSATPQAPTTPPATPTISNTTAGDSQVSLTWGSVTSATYYKLYRSQASFSVNNSVYSVVGTVYAPSTTFTDTGLTNGTKYYYTLSAGNTAGQSSMSAEVSATPIQAPPVITVPGTTTLTGFESSSTAKLSWTSVTGATYYNVKRALTSGGPYTTIAANQTGLSYTDYSLGRYYYVVTAANAVGESSNSNEVMLLLESNHSSGGGGGGGGSSSGDASKLSYSDAKIDKDESGKSVAKVSVSSDDLSKAFGALKDGSPQKISIEINASANVAKADFSARALTDGLKNASNAIISIKFGNVTYDLPLKSLNISQLVKDLGTDSKNVNLVISIEKVSGSTADKISQTAKDSGVKPVGDAIDFTVTAETKDKSIEVKDFGKTYVERTITIPQKLDGTKVAGLLYDPTAGKLNFVPMLVSSSDKETVVTLKRNGNSIYSVVQSEKTFDDLKGHWAKSDVELLASKLVVNGASNTAFAPDQQISRAEFAALAVRALGLNEEVAGKFSDVAASEWYAGSIGAAVKAGLVEGLTDTMFSPNSNITREQMAVIISRASKFAGTDVKLEKEKQTELLSKFTDSKSISSWAQTAVAQSIESGIINGVSDKEFASTSNATRAQATVMLKRLLTNLKFIN